MKELDPGFLQRTLDVAGKKIEAAKSPAAINAVVEKVICTLVDSEFASLWIFDEKRGVLVREREDGTPRELAIQEQQGIIARSFLTMSGGIYNYLASEKEYVARFDNPDNIRIKSKLIVPLVDGERFLGLATAYSSVRKIRNFTEKDLRLLEALSPFLIETIYKIRPDLRDETIERVYLDSSLQKKAEIVSATVETMRREESQKKEEEASRPDELLGFLANTVHDIRTPANSLYGFLELLEEQLEDARLLQFVRNAKESAQFINELTTSILDRISLQRGQKREPVTINPTKFFADIAAVFSANMYDKRIDYNIYIDPELPAEIRIDAFRLKRVILNLLGNAWKFTPRGKSITFSVEYNPDTKRMAVSVEDTGIGIAKEKQEKIFEAFQQAEDETALEYGGTGLGLSISAQYVAELGGSLQLESELEQGSRFFFEIPVQIEDETSRFPVLATVPARVDMLMEEKHTVPAQNILRYFRRLGLERDQVRELTSIKQINPTTTHLIVFSSLVSPEEIERLKAEGIMVLVIEEELFSLTGDARYENLEVVSAYTFYLPELYAFLAEGSRGEGKITRTRNALVVDDNRINIELLRTMLEGELYQVDTAATGEEALRLLGNALDEGTPYAIALVDRHLPDLNGTELMERYREKEKRYGIPPIFAVSITGDPQIDPREEKLFDRIMRKPFKRQEFKTILSEAEKR